MWMVVIFGVGKTVVMVLAQLGLRRLIARFQAY